MEYTNKRNRVRRWIIFLVSCCVALLDLGLVLTFGSVFLQLLDRFGENRASTATVQSIFVGTMTSCSVVAGVLIRKIGVGRVSFIGAVMVAGGFIFSFFAKSILMLDVFIGVVAGTGVSFIFVSSTVVARSCFDGHAGDLAVGGHSMCGGVGSVTYPYIFRELEKHYFIHETFLLVGGFLLNNVAISLMFLANERELQRQSRGKAHKENYTKYNDIDVTTEGSGTSRRVGMCHILVRLWKSVLQLMNVRYILVLFGAGLAIGSNTGYIIVFNDIYAWKGFTKDDTVLSFTIFHAFSAASRLLPLIANKLRPQTDLMSLLACCAFGGCVGQTLVLFTSQIHFSIVTNIFAGITQGGLMSGSSIAVAKLSTQESFAVAFGLLLTLIGVLSLAVGVIAGYIRDSNQSYEVAIILFAALNGIGACLYIAGKVGKVFKCCRKGQKIYISNDDGTSNPKQIAHVSFTQNNDNG